MREAFRRLRDRFPDPRFAHNRFGFFRRHGVDGEDVTQKDRFKNNKENENFKQERHDGEDSAPEYIGRAISSGCIRMTNEDVIDLYGHVKIGTIVVVLAPGA